MPWTSAEARREKPRFRRTHIGRGEPRGHRGVVDQRGAAADPVDALQHGQCRDHERVLLGRQPDQLVVHGPVDEEVHQAVGTFGDDLAGFFPLQDVDDRQLLPRVRGPDNRGDDLPGEPGCAVIVDDLDVVGTFGDPGVNERLCLCRCGDRGDLDAVFGPVPAGGRDQRPGRTQVGAAVGLPRRLLRPHPGRERLVGEHVQLERHAEDDRLLEMIGRERVGVAIDQPGEQRLPRSRRRPWHHRARRLPARAGPRGRRGRSPWSKRRHGSRRRPARRGRRGPPRRPPDRRQPAVRRPPPRRVS